MMKYGLAAILAVVAAVPASAADDKSVYEVTNQVTYRVEVNGGYDRVAVSGVHKGGATYGGVLGFDVPLGKTIFAGFELEGNGSTIKECGFGACVKAGRNLGAVARIGANVGSGIKVYALAGYTNARVVATSGGFSGHENLDGVRVGAGVQIAVTKLAYTKLEYRYSNYEQGYSRNEVIAGLGLGF